jgi:hypothetical protein
VQIVTASEPGSPDKPNEDGVVVTANMTAVLDGATVRTETGCIHGVPWLVKNLAGSLVKNKDLLPAEALALAITETAQAHREACDLDHPGTPAAAVAIIQAHGDYLRYLVLGDVTIIVEEDDGLRIITDNRVDATAVAERVAADALPTGSPEKSEALIRMKHAELAARNVAGGYWVAAADPAVVSQALTGEIPTKEIRRLALLTDGATRAVITFKLYNWPDLLDMLIAAGPSELIKQVRTAENADASGTWYRRNKVHDDATIATIQF